MVVKEIIFMDSQEDLAEAEVLVTDGKYDLFCFCHPCVYKVNDKIIEPLSCLDSDNIVISEEKDEGEEKHSNTIYADACLIKKKVSYRSEKFLFLYMQILFQKTSHKVLILSLM